MFRTHVHRRSVHDEDRHLAFEDGDGCLVVCAIDGHGGAAAADLCAARGAEVYRAAKRECADDVHACLRSTFARLHGLCTQLRCQSGCALTMVRLHRETGRVTCANVGDATALVISSTSHRHLSVSHRLQDNAFERTRLGSHIGFVNGQGPPRLFPGGLACSRSIGDADCPHVSAEPHLCDDRLRAHEDLVICTDGITDCTSAKRMVALFEYHNPQYLHSTRCLDDATAIVVSRSSRATTSPMLSRMLFRRASHSSGGSSSDEDATIVPVVL